MIKYKLVCESCNLLFDSWFASSKEFENLKKKKLLSCHVCGSKKIEKTLMAPKLINNTNKDNENNKNLKFQEINKKIKVDNLVIRNLIVKYKQLNLKDEYFKNEKK